MQGPGGDRNNGESRPVQCAVSSTDRQVHQHVDGRVVKTTAAEHDQILNGEGAVGDDGVVSRDERLYAQTTGSSVSHNSDNRRVTDDRQPTRRNKIASSVGRKPISRCKPTVIDCSANGGLGNKGQCVGEAGKV